MTDMLAPFSEERNRHTLSESDITSRRSIGRRSLVTVLGIGVGVAVLGLLGAVTLADAKPRLCGKRCRDDND